MIVRCKFQISHVTNWNRKYALKSSFLPTFLIAVNTWFTFFFHFHRRWNPQGWLYQASRWIGRSWGWRWLFPLRTLLGQIVRQGLNHSANQNPIKRLVDFFNGENHFQTAHNLWHITSTLLQNGGLKNRLKNNQDPKINYQIFGNRTMAIQNGEPERKKIREINRLYTFLIYFFSEVIS